MKLPDGIGDQPINKTIEQHPFIGELLEKYEIGCVTCGVGTWSAFTLSVMKLKRKSNRKFMTT